MEDNMSNIADSVAEATATRDMENEDWQKAVAITGLISTNKEAYVERARELVDRSVATQTSAGHLSYGSHGRLPPEIADELEWPAYDSFQWQCHGAAVGRNCLQMHERTSDEKYLEAAERQVEALESAVRTADGAISYNSGVVELWVDSLYMVPPFLARYANLTEKPDLFDKSTNEVMTQSRHLQDRCTGLFRHVWREEPNSYPESTFWSRGNGWAAAGIIDTLEAVPESHPQWNDVLNVFRRLMQTVTEYQDQSGFWRNVLDDSMSPLETSGTLMFAYVLDRGLELGYLDDENHAAAAESALEVCRGVVDKNGTVRRVAVPPGGPGVALGHTSYGQGWFLIARSQVDG